MVRINKSKLLLTSNGVIVNLKVDVTIEEILCVTKDSNNPILNAVKQ